MSDIKLFATNGGNVREIPGTSTALEKSLQTLIENHLATFLQMRFVASEYSTGVRHGGRIDTLALDENGCPVIIEYKRATNENVINQGLFYLDWLMDHQAEFELKVQKELGQEAMDSVDWSAPRLVCIAGGFTKYDEHAVQQMNRNIELIRYRRFGDELLAFEMINAVTSTGQGVDAVGKSPSSTSSKPKTVLDNLAMMDQERSDLFDALRSYVFALGDDVQEKTLKHYIAFKRLSNFVCVGYWPTTRALTMWVKVNPDTIALQEGFTRDVRSIGHLGTGDLEITLRTMSDLERAKPLIEKSYEGS
ncbi:MAG: DUF5655 domain-containing protein [Rhodothermales bacterium]